MKYLKNSKLVFVIFFLINLSLFTPIETLYFLNKGLPVQIISILNLTVPLICAIMEIPTGVLGDHIGRKYTFVMAVVALALSSLILLFANNIILYFLVYIVEGMGWSLFSGNTDAIIVEESNKKKIDVGTQLAFIYTGFTFSPIIAGVLNSFIISKTANSFRLLIIVTFLFRLLSIVISLFVKVEGSSNRNSTPLNIFHNCISFIKSNKTCLLIVVYEATGRLQFYIPVLVQTILSHNKFDIKMFGLIYTCLQVVVTLSQLYANKVMLKLKTYKTLKYSTIMLTLGAALLIPQKSILAIIGMGIIIGIGPIRNQPLMIIKNKMINNDIRSSYISTLSFMVLVLNFILLSIIGFIFSVIPLGALILLTFFVIIGGLSTQKRIANIIKG